MRLSPLLGCLALIFVARSGLAQSDAAKTQAIARFQEGIKLHDKGQEEEAYLRFTQAYAVVQTPAILFNLARTEQLTGRSVDAVVHFRAYVALPEHPKVTPEFRAMARTYITELEARLGRLTIDAPTGAVIAVDGKEVQGTVVDVLPGPHQVAARVGDQQASAQVTAVAGTAVTAHLPFVSGLVPAPAVIVPVVAPVAALEPPTTNHSARSIAVGTAAGIAVVGLGVGIGFLVDARSQASDFNTFQTTHRNACVNPSSTLCAEGHSKDSNVAQSSVVSDVGFAVGGVALATGAVLWLVWPRDASKTSAGPWIRPNLGVGLYTVDVGGRF
jgi:hypothetical protein